MTLNIRVVLQSLAFCAMLGWSAANGATILKLSLADITGGDLEMGAGGALGTKLDGDGSTTGAQNTAIEYSGFLDSLFADVTTNTASITIAGIQKTGPISVFGGTVITQDFTGGTFSLYSPSNGLLLSGSLQSSTLTGALGGTANGSLFSTGTNNFTGGSLLPYLKANTLNLTMTLTNVNNGAGFSVSGGPFVLQPFSADSFVTISAEPIPEPASIAVVVIGAAGFALARRRRLNRCIAG